MGVIDIRMRSQSLGNVGATPMHATPDFARAAAIRGQTDAMRAQMLSDGIGRLGRLAGIGVNALVQMRQREDDRTVTNAANEIQRRCDAYMNGDGSPGAGAWNEAVKDGGEWIDRNEKQFEKIYTDVFGSDKTVGGMGLSRSQQEAVRRRLFAYREGWANRQRGKATAVYDRDELDGATRWSANTERTLLGGYTDAAWDEWMNAGSHELAVRRRQGLVASPEAEADFWRERAGRVVQNEIGRRLGEFSDRFSESADPADVAAFYDGQIELAESGKDSVVPGHEAVRSVLGDDADAIGKGYVDALKAAKKKAVRNAEANLRNKMTHVAQASHEATAELELSREWESMGAGQRADAYRDHLKSPSGVVDAEGRVLTWEEAYKEYAPIRGKAVQRAIDHYDLEEKRLKASAAKKANADAVAPVAESPYAKEGQEDVGFYVRMKKKIIDMGRDRTDVNSLLEEVDANQGKLTYTHYLSLYNDLTKERDEANVRVRNEVFTKFLEIGEDTFTKAVDRTARGSKASAAAIETLLGSSNAEYKRSWVPYDPNFTIEDVDAAVEYVDRYLKENPGDMAGAKKALDEIVKPISQAARRRTFRERILKQTSKGTFDSREAFKGE